MGSSGVGTIFANNRYTKLRIYVSQTISLYREGKLLAETWFLQGKV